MGPSPPDLDCRAKHNRAQVIGANFYRKVGRRRRYGVSKSYSDSEPSCGQDPTVFSDDNSFNMEKLMGTASQKTTPLSLQNMYRYASVGKPAQRLRNAQFLHNELPIDSLRWWADPQRHGDDGYSSQGLFSKAHAGPLYLLNHARDGVRRGV